MLPVAALERAQHEMLDWAGTGTSVMESQPPRQGVRSGPQRGDLPDEGAARPAGRLPGPLPAGRREPQFAHGPDEPALPGQTADYINTGTWAKKAIAEAKLFGTVNVAWGGDKGNATQIPKQDELKLTPGARYVHITSNNTIEGTQFHAFPDTRGVPLVCDMSSDFLWAPFDPKPFGLIYAGAQKNIGPAGVIAVIIRKDILRAVPGPSIPTILKYATARQGELALQHAAVLRDLHGPQRARAREGDGRPDGDGGPQPQEGAG